MVSTAPGNALGRHHGLGSIEHQGRIGVRAFSAGDSICPVVWTRPSHGNSVGVRVLASQRRCSIGKRVGCLCSGGATDRPCIRLLRHLCRHCLGQLHQAGRGAEASHAGRQHRGAILGAGGVFLRDLAASHLPSARATPRLTFSACRPLTRPDTMRCDLPRLWSRCDLLT